MDGPRVPRRSPLALLAAVTLLLLLAAVGVRALADAELSSRPPVGLDARLVANVILLIGCLLGVAAVVLSRGRRIRGKPRPRKPPKWWAPLVLATYLALTLALLALLADRLDLFGSGEPEPSAPGSGPDLPAVDVPGSLPTAAEVLLALVCLLAAVATSRWLATRRDAAVFPAAEDALPPQAWATLRDAVNSGDSALQDTADPRQAIIACYAAMERSLARAGAPPRRADTPEELLTRARRGGLVRSPAAGLLTDLFHEARFSSHPIAAEQRDAAAAALAALRDDLEADHRADHRTGTG